VHRAALHALAREPLSQRESLTGLVYAPASGNSEMQKTAFRKHIGRGHLCKLNALEAGFLHTSETIG
jgi:hypothetical protein